MAEHIPLYPWSRREAIRTGERDDWLRSYQENCYCANAIESAISKSYQDNHLAQDCAKGVVEMYGFDRVNWVLANTIQDNTSDIRISDENKEWAKGFSIPKGEIDFHRNFLVSSHLGLVNLFTNQAREMWQKLGLLDKTHCIDEGREPLDYTGKVVVVRPNILKDEYKTPEYQLFYASGGNGCRPHALGTKVFGEFLWDGERTHLARGDFIGVIQDEHLPDWARERVAEITGDEDPDEDEDIETGGIHANQDISG